MTANYQDAPHPAKLFSERLRAADDTRYVYTYPFKGAYRPLPSDCSVLDHWSAAAGPLNIYVHIPYCDMKCTFCNLLTTTRHDAEVEKQYVSALIHEIDLLTEAHDWGTFDVDSLYIGGGTPTVLSVDLLQQFLGRLRDAFRFSPHAELALEATPDSVDASSLRCLRNLGFQRISFGVQSFDGDELRGLARAYDPALASQAVEEALSIGFANVNVDLLYGLPNQTVAAWRRNLQQAIDIGAPTITAYPLVFRSQTRLGRVHDEQTTAFPDGALRNAMYDIAADLLINNGYHQYSSVAFTKVAVGCRQETNEFTGVPTLGLGAGAISYGPTAHYSSGAYYALESPAQTVAAYLEHIRDGKLPIRSGILLDAGECQRRFIILGLSYEGFAREDFIARFGETPERNFSDEFRVLLDEDCLVESASRIVLSPRGRRATSLVADLFASDPVRRLASSYR